MVNQILLAKDVSYPFSERLACSVGMRQSIPSDSSKIEIPHQPLGDRSYHSTLHTSHQLALGKRRSLEMQATHHTIRTHTLIVLAELHLVAHQWLHLLFKLTLAEALEEIATSISKQARFNDEHALNISLNYFHFMIIINLYRVKKGLLGSIPEK